MSVDITTPDPRLQLEARTVLGEAERGQLTARQDRAQSCRARLPPPSTPTTVSNQQHSHPLSVCLSLVQNITHKLTPSPTLVKNSWKVHKRFRDSSLGSLFQEEWEWSEASQLINVWLKYSYLGLTGLGDYLEANIQTSQLPSDLSSLLSLSVALWASLPSLNMEYLPHFIHLSSLFSGQQETVINVSKE